VKCFAHRGASAKCPHRGLLNRASHSILHFRSKSPRRARRRRGSRSAREFAVLIQRLVTVSRSATGGHRSNSNAPHAQPGADPRGLHASAKRAAVGQERSAGYNPVIETLRRFRGLPVRHPRSSARRSDSSTPVPLSRSPLSFRTATHLRARLYSYPLTLFVLTLACRGRGEDAGKAA